MILRSRNIALLAGAAVLAAVTAGAGEKVQIKGSTDVELPKPTRNIEENRRFKLDTSNTNPGDAYVTPPALDASPLLDKKTKEMLDKKRNWIFVNPYKAQYDSKTSDFLSGEKGTGLFEHRWMQGDEEKSQVERFIEEKDKRRSDSNSDRDRDGDDDRDRDRDRTASKDSPFGNNENDPRKEESAPSLFGKEKKTLQIGGPIAISERSAFEDRLERTPFADRTFADKQLDSRGVDKEKITNQRLQSDEAFTRILRGARDSDQGLVGNTDRLTGTKLEPITPSLDGTRREANPFTARSSDQFLNLGRGDNRGVTFSGPGGIGSGGNFSSRSVVDDIGTKAPSAPSFNTMPAAVSPAAQVPSSGNSFALPFPRRKF